MEKTYTKVFKKIMYFFIIILLIPCIFITIVMYSYYTKMFIKNKGSDMLQQLVQTQELIDYLLKDAEHYLTNLAVNEENYQRIKQINFKNHNAILKMEQWINSITLVKEHVYSMYMHEYKHGMLITSYKNKTVISYKKASIDSKINENKWIYTWAIPAYITERGQKVFSLKKQIKNHENQQPVGEIYINIREKHIYNNIVAHLINSDEGKDIIIMDKEDKIISSNNIQLIGHKIEHFKLEKNKGYFIQTIKGSKKLVAYIISPYTNWKYIYTVPYDNINIDILQIIKRLIIINIIAIVIAGILAGIFTKTIYYPIKILKNAMISVGQGNFETEIKEYRKDEFNILYSGFNHMTKEIKQLVNELYYMKILNKESQLKLLQSQMNPHFLYNTLDCIHWMSKMGKKQEVTELIFSLSNFYKLSLNEGNEWISIQNNIKLIREYLKIQQIRFKDKFDVKIDVKSELLPKLILPFIIQPLVENAVHHGIENKKGKGTIHINIFKKKRDIVIQVEDTGIGIKKIKLKQIRNMLKQQMVNEDNFALVNIQKRIKITYGECYGIKIESNENHGTKATINLPL